MPNQITVANLDKSKFIDAVSRYNKSKIIYYGTNNLITFTTYKKQIPPVSPNDTYTVIPPGGMEYRPDLVSQKVYGSPNFWWKIMEANDIKDIYDFKAGLNIRLPGNVYS